MVSKSFRLRPSELLKVEDEYAAFCLDEACVDIQYRISHGDEIRFYRNMLITEESKNDTIAFLREVEKRGGIID